MTNTLYLLLKEYLRIHPEATDDTIIFQLNRIQLTVGSIKVAITRECDFCKFGELEVNENPCSNCQYYSKFKLNV